jgi:pimeloyl-ACP methyl ester carboxylesterase
MSHTLRFDFLVPENGTNVRSSNRAAPAVPPSARAARAAAGFFSAASPELAALFAERVFRTPRRAPRPAIEVEALGRARRFAIPFGDRHLAAWEWGEVGPRVLLVHGWEGRGSQLWPFVEPLVEQGHRVVTFDTPAHGDSPGERTSFTEFAASIEAASDALGSLSAVIAHSMGGATTAYVASRRPIARRYAMIAPPRRFLDFAEHFSRSFALSPEAHARFVARLDRALGVPAESLVMDERVRGMDVPLLVVHDADDREVPFDRGARIAASWPSATLHRTDGLGHRRILRDPEVVRIVNRFVAYGRAP